jgi:hypothetical protein
VTEYTPGPWKVREESELWIEAAEGTVAVVPPSLVSEDGYDLIPNDYANARLIAQAPNLLEAAKAARECIKWLPNIPENVEAMDALDAAISAAEGVE